MAFGDLDRTAMLADFGVDVVYSGTTVKGIYDEIGWDGLSGQGVSVSAVGKSVLIATGSINPPQAASLTVGGTTYTVIDTDPDPPDGRFTRIMLKG